MGCPVTVTSNPRTSTLLRPVLASALVWLCATSLANGLDPNRRISQYGHTAWRVQDGAIAPGYTIAQTTDGYLWVGTSEGLMRFDGVRFVPWQAPTGQSLPSRHFTALLGSRDGALWIGTTQGLSRWKDGQLRTFTDSAHPAGIGVIIEDNSGTIWATRYGSGAREGPLCSVSVETLRCFGRNDGIPVSYGLGLTTDPTGNIWFGGRVLCRWRAGSPAVTYFGDIADKLAKGDGVIDVAVAPSGTVWATLDGVGADMGVRYYSRGKWTSYVVTGFNGAKVRSHALLLDRQGALWVGTENEGIYRIYDGIADHYDVSDGLSGNVAGLLFEDSEGNIWARTDGGLDMFRNTPIISYTTHQRLSGADLRSVLTLRDGSVWVATEADVEILRKRGDLTVVTDRKLPGHNFTSMFEDNAGAIWLAVDNKLMHFQNGRFREITRQDGQPFAAEGQVRGIAEDTKGNIWVLTSRGHLFTIEGKKLREQMSPTHESGSPKYLAAELNGGVWTGAQKGVISYYHNGKRKTVSLADSHGPVDIHGLFVDADDALLVSTSEGLYRRKDDQQDALTSGNGLPCNMVYNAIRDNHSALWIYTQCGLVKIDAPAWKKWTEEPQTQVPVTVLGALDGALAGTGDPFQPAASKAPDGRLWFVTGVAAQVLDPDHLYNDTPPPPVYVEGMLADHKVLPTRALVRLPALTRDLQIDYTAPSFSVPQNVRFRYRLEGYDQEWQDAGTRRQAFYTDLAPGNYRFRVIACNSRGVWNTIGASLDFSVLPAYYQTAWFRAACAFLLLLLVWGLYRLRVRGLHQRFEIGLEARVSERTRIARELHDTLLQNFHGSLLRFQAASNLLPNRPEEARKKLDGAIDQASEAITEARGAVEGLRSPALANSELGIAIKTFGEELASGETGSKPPVLEVTVEGEPRDLDLNVRDELYRIAAEALRNAFHHAGANRVEVAIRYEARQLRMRIRDDGKGINPDIAAGAGRAGHYGMHGMRERAKLMGGDLEVWSNLSAGTEIELTVPATAAYETDHPHRRLFRKEA